MPIKYTIFFIISMQKTAEKDFFFDFFSSRGFFPSASSLCKYRKAVFASSLSEDDKNGFFSNKTAYFAAAAALHLATRASKRLPYSM